MSRENHTVDLLQKIHSMLQMHGKISIVQDILSQIQFNIKNIYAYFETLSTSTINPTLINTLD